MPSGQPVPVTAMTPYDDQPIPVVATRVTRAMTAPSLSRRPSSIFSDEYTSLTLSKHTLFPTPVDARPALGKGRRRGVRWSTGVVGTKAGNPSVLHELQLQRTPRRCQHLPPPERVWVPHAADQQRAGTQVRFVPPPRLGLRAGHIQLLLLQLRRLHLHRNAGGERASTEASGAPRHTRAPKTARHLPKASRTLTPSLLGRMVSIGSHLPQPTPSTSNCRCGHLRALDPPHPQHPPPPHPLHPMRALPHCPVPHMPPPHPDPLLTRFTTCYSPQLYLLRTHHAPPTTARSSTSTLAPRRTRSRPSLASAGAR